MTINDRTLKILKEIYEVASNSNEINDHDYNGWVNIDLKKVASQFNSLNENSLHYTLVHIDDHHKWYDYTSIYTNINPNVLGQRITQYEEMKTSQKNESTIAKNSKKSIWIAIVAAIISFVSLGISFYKSSDPISLSISEYNEEITRLTKSEKELKSDISILKTKIDNQGKKTAYLIEELENKILELDITKETLPPSTP